MGVALSVNGKSYDGIDVKILMLGNEAREVSAAKYGFSRDHENHYSLGSDEPTNYSIGPKKYEEGSLTMSLKELVAIEDAAGGNKDITLIKPFITLFARLNEGNKIVVDEVLWKFKNWGREVSIDTLGDGKEFGMHTISIKPGV